MNTKKVMKFFSVLASLGSGSYGAAGIVRDLYTDHLLQNQTEPYTSLYNQYIDDHAGRGTYADCISTPSIESRLRCNPSGARKGRSLINKAKAHGLNVSEDLPLYVAASAMMLGVVGLFVSKKPALTHEQVEQRLLPYRQLHQRLLDTGLKEDAPEEFYDPLHMVLMDEPIKTSSNNGAIKVTYNAQTVPLLKSCPYSRTPIVVIGPDHELKQRIQAYVARKERVAEKIKASAALAEEKKQSSAHAPEKRRRGLRR